jgi:hypothetical protein
MVKEHSDGSKTTIYPLKLAPEKVFIDVCTKLYIKLPLSKINKGGDSDGPE